MLEVVVFQLIQLSMELTQVKHHYKIHISLGTATVQVAFFLDGNAFASYIINFPVVVTQDALVSTFSFGPATLITTSFAVPCKIYFYLFIFKRWKWFTNCKLYCKKSKSIPWILIIAIHYISIIIFVIQFFHFFCTYCFLR